MPNINFFGKKTLIGSSSTFLEMLTSISRFARHERPVLVMGEQVAGKGLPVGYQ